MKLPLEQIEVGDRVRSELKRIPSLAKSIKRVGLIEPLVVSKREDDSYKLIAGRRRLEACRELDWEEVPVVIKEHLDEAQELEMELEENVRRDNLPWHEVVEARARLHELYQEIYGESQQGKEGGWTIEDTAKKVGVEKSTISKDLKLAEAVDVFPDLKEQSSKKSARKKYQDMEREVAGVLVQRQVEREQSFSNIHNDSFVAILRDFGTHKVDFITLDLPWGIGIDGSGAIARTEAHKSAANGEQKIFPDDPEEALDLFDLAFTYCHRVLKENRHMMVFLGEQYLAKIIEMAERYFEVNPVPAIWDKEVPGRPPKYWLSPQHEFILDVSKGKREPMPKHGTLFRHRRVSPNKKIHPTQKPTALLRDLIEVYTIPGETVLDPAMGSGSSIVAALQTGRKAIGIEKDESTYGKALAWIKETTDELGLENGSES